MSFCEGCIDLKELPGKEQGSTQQINGVTTYVSKGSRKGNVVVATDIYGLGIPNPKIVADIIANESGLNVYIPDIFPNGPIKPDDFQLPNKASSGPPSEERMGKNFENFMAWMGKGHGPDKTYPIFKKVIDEVSKEGPTGAIGYCYGAKLAVIAAQEGAVKGIALYHPSLLEASDAEKIQTKTLLNEAELDPLFGELKDTFEKTLKSRDLLDSRTKQYPNTVHGL